MRRASFLHGWSRHAIAELLEMKLTGPAAGRAAAVPRRAFAARRPAAAAAGAPTPAPRGADLAAGQAGGAAQHRQQQQAAQFHQISTLWQVQKAPAGFYKNGPGRARAGDDAAGAGAAAARLAAARQLAATLRYEAERGHGNVVGRGGEPFAAFAESALAALGAAGGGAGAAAAAIAPRLRGYDAAPPAARAALVREAAAAVAALEAALEAALPEHAAHPARADRYGAAPAAAPAPPPLPVMPPPADPDALASEAHEEETAAAVAAAAAASLAEPRPAPSSAAEPAAEPALVLVDGRRVRAETAAFRASFAVAAADLAAGGAAVGDVSSGEQRSEAWLALRARRLTASAFAKALGLFEGDRRALWEEKVGLAPPFAGNAATAWGVAAEERALAAYAASTGQAVEACMFRAKRDDAPHGWLGASPDGLIDILGVDGAGAGAAPITPAPFRGAGVLSGAGPGVLEVKCPFNKGAPEKAVPPSRAIWYYMPQVQGLMDVFDREWCNLYVWTPARGAALFHIRRDRAYWSACFAVLAEFWWQHAVPARQAAEAGAGREALAALAPSAEHAATPRLREWSKELAAAAPATFFAPLPERR
jgi:putative phage-type endonuclease